MTESPLMSTVAIQNSFSMSLKASGLQADLIIPTLKRKSVAICIFQTPLMYMLLQLWKNKQKISKQTNLNQPHNGKRTFRLDFFLKKILVDYLHSLVYFHISELSGRENTTLGIKPIKNTCPLSSGKSRRQAWRGKDVSAVLFYRMGYVWGFGEYGFIFSLLGTGFPRGARRECSSCSFA